MDDNERASVKEVLTLARMAIVAMLVVGGYLNRSVIIGMIWMPLPAILGAAALGAAGSMAFEYIMSSGEATTQDYAVAGVVGALPVGLGARGAAGLGQKALGLRHVRKGDRVGDVAYVYMHPSSKVFLGPEAKAIGSGVLANVAVGHALDVYQSRGDQGSSLSSIPGVAKPGPIGSPSTPRIGARSTGRGVPSSRRGRASRSPYCRVHKKRHWCKYTKR